MRKYTNFFRFFAPAEPVEPKEFLQNLRTRAFAALDRAQPVDHSAGFVQVDDTGATSFGVGEVFSGEYAHFAWRIDEIVIPSWAVRDELAKWVVAFTAANKRPPGRREKTEQKAEIRHTLRQRASIRSQVFDVVWRPETGQIEVWAGRQKIVDEVQAAIEAVLGAKIVPVLPATIADRIGLSERALAPTAALSTPNDAPREAVDVEAGDQIEAEQGKARETFLRGRSYLGRELLTWLLWRSESGEPLFAVEGAPVSALFTDKLALHAVAGEVVTGTVRGAMSPYSELVRRGVGRGLLVEQARLKVSIGPRAYAFTVDASTFAFKSLKRPDLLAENEDEALLELFAQSNELGDVVEQIVGAFLQLRTSTAWAHDVVPAIREWAGAAA